VCVYVVVLSGRIACVFLFRLFFRLLLPLLVLLVVVAPVRILWFPLGPSEYTPTVSSHAPLLSLLAILLSGTLSVSSLHLISTIHLPSDLSNHNTHTHSHSHMYTQLLKQTVSIAYAYVTDLTSAEERAVQLALVDAMVQLGFAFGPVVGGQLSEYDMRYPAFLSASVYLINFLIGYLTLPRIPVHVVGVKSSSSSSSSSSPPPSSSTSASSSSPSVGSSYSASIPSSPWSIRSMQVGVSEAIHSFRQAFSERRVSFWLVFHVIASLAVMLFDSTFPMWLKANFDLSPKETGYVYFLSRTHTHTHTLSLSLSR
jgi:Major Facilitator Superfamily